MQCKINSLLDILLLITYHTDKKNNFAKTMLLLSYAKFTVPGSPRSPGGPSTSSRPCSPCSPLKPTISSPKKNKSINL